MIAKLCKFTKIHWLLYLKLVNFMVYKLYLKKAVQEGIELASLCDVCGAKAGVQISSLRPRNQSLKPKH